MKPTVLIVAALGAGLLGMLALSSVLYFGLSPVAPEPQIHAMAPVAAAPADRSDELEALEAQLAMVSHRLAELEQQVAQSAHASARRSIAPEQATHAAALSSEPAAGLGISAADREAVAKILSSVRAEEQQVRDEARLVREEERATQRAAEIAKELGLSLADEVALGDHLVESSMKRNALMAEVRQDGFDPATMRESFMEQREWSSEQLLTLFGESLAGQIEALERGNRGGFRGPGGRGDTTGQGGQGRQR